MILTTLVTTTNAHDLIDRVYSYNNGIYVR